MLLFSIWYALRNSPSLRVFSSSCSGLEAAAAACAWAAALFLVVLEPALAAEALVEVAAWPAEAADGRPWAEAAEYDMVEVPLLLLLLLLLDLSKGAIFAIGLFAVAGGTDVGLSVD